MQALQGRQCAICLDTPTRPVLLDGCFHDFCFSCMEEWIRVCGTTPATCPLCKTGVKYFLCDIGEDWSFTRYDVTTGRSERRGSTTVAACRRDVVYQRQLLAVPPQPYVAQWQGQAFPTSSPHSGARSVALPDVTLSAMERNRARLHSWVRRELACVLGHDDVRVFANVVLTSLDKHGTVEPRGASSKRRRWQLKASAAKPSVRLPPPRTPRHRAVPSLRDALIDVVGEQHAGAFVHELRCFSVSRLSSEDYDATTPYVPRANVLARPMLLMEVAAGGVPPPAPTTTGPTGSGGGAGGGADAAAAGNGGGASGGGATTAAASGHGDSSAAVGGKRDRADATAPAPRSVRQRKLEDVREELASLHATLSELQAL